MSAATIAATLSADPTEYQPSSDGVIIVSSFISQHSFRRARSFLKVNRRYSFGAAVFFDDTSGTVGIDIDVDRSMGAFARIFVINIDVGRPILVVMGLNKYPRLVFSCSHNIFLLQNVS